ncbi:3-oxoacyl-reductase [Ophiobolus disseminans]|uniref:3-oxoacyl-reductase n=1 Tax=Ophiobolus disseminans TaxID=1469910 RepID=A0A6A6ZTL6_9PLEO|nr:3-oxoacyl-reductase [Ophiobolus disseminans]
MEKLSGKRVLVFGGTSGIGLGVARGVLEAGCQDLTISSSNPEKLASAASRLQSSHENARITTSVCDLQNPNTLDRNVENLFLSLNPAGQKFDHVVYAAGDPVKLPPFLEQTVQSMLDAGTVRFFGALIVAKHAHKHMHITAKSSITFTGGINSSLPLQGWTLHGAYFAALEGAMKSLALEFRPLRVNLVSPGPVLTEAWENVPPEIRKPLEDRMLSRCATGAMAMVAEVAEAYVYLMGNSNATGSVVVTDGGVTIMGF